MTDNTQPEALRIADALEYCDASVARQAINELRRQHARIAELEAQLESIGAGGVSGPLMDRAADHFPGVTKMAARWYMVNKAGMATLCTDRADAEKEAEDAQRLWPHMGPHRAVQLVEVDSIEASAGSEPVIGWHAFPHYLQHPDGRLLRTASDLLARHGYQGCAEPLRAMSDVLLPTNPSPPEGMVGGWMPIETAPKDGTRILLHPAVEVHDAWSKGYWSEQHKCWIVGGSASGVTHTHWMHLPLPPTTSAGSGKGE